MSTPPDNKNGCCGCFLLSVLLLFVLAFIGSLLPDQKDKEAQSPSSSSATAKPKTKEQRKKEQQAELIRKKQEANARAETARKEREEWDVRGLVLLLPSVQSVHGEYGDVKITGEVVNRTGRTLSLAQITFNLYDSSGAQIGSAIASINGLEPDGRWKFQAVTTVDSFASYKPSDMSSF